MTDAIITGPGLYVLRNGDFVAIMRQDSAGWYSAEDWLLWHRSGTSDDRGISVEGADYDIIRRATPEEAARFCGGGE